MSRAREDGAKDQALDDAMRKRVQTMRKLMQPGKRTSHPFLNMATGMAPCPGCGLAYDRKMERCPGCGQETKKGR